MRNMLYIIWGSLCLLLVISGCKSTDGAKAPVSLTWKMGAVEVQPGYYENSFVLKNISDVPLEKDWIIYYSQLPREILQEESAPVKVEVVNANFFRMYPAENFQPLAPGDSLTVKFCCTNGLKKMSHAPEGTYWVSQSGSKQGIPLPVGLTIQPLKGMETEDWYPAPDKIYASNLALETTAQLQQTDIFPSVKEAVPATGKEGFAIENKVKLTFHPDFANEAELLKEKLATIHGLEVVSEAPVTVHLDYLPERETAVNGEYYRIDTGNGLINISASTSHGIFNGTQTLLSLLKGQEKLFRFPGFYVQRRSIRQYQSPYAALVLGDIGEVSPADVEEDEYYQNGDFIGKQGVERAYEKQLRGEKGIQILLRDARGRIKGRYMDGKLDTKTVPGKNLTLGLDLELQALGERLMEGKLGSIVAIEPSTGEVLCMVSSPTYDPRMMVGRQRGKNHLALSRNPLKPVLNRSIMGQYPPGSTFKTTQALTFLQEGIITPETAYPCYHGFIYRGLKVGCHGHAAPAKLGPAIGTSCNAYF